MEVVTISTDTVEKFINYFKEKEKEVNKDEYTHFMMIDETVHSFLDEYFSDKTFCHGNILWHKAGIPPHIDECGMGNTQSIIVPLIVNNPDQKLIVFDQTYDKECTWFGNLQAEMNPDRSYGSERHEPPYKTPGVQGLTGKPCPKELTDHLPTYYGEDMYFGLSGDVINYEVGTAIIFDSQRIHTTGTMTGEKLAVTSFVK